METWFGPQPQPIGRVKKPGTVPSAVHGCGVLSMTYEGRGDCTQGFFTHLIGPAANVKGRLAAESLNITTRSPSSAEPGPTARERNENCSRAPSATCIFAQNE